eukprot:CAMPEP_0176425456 /NCGR_PEP_ID=MMETSP0127-20121128/11398_1 /TAXON_ID=938130 /ORGANISM="Platyophrya macrostoma, Strain WH" /LENGTH=337 /DNA_ID=CAMNT_0017806617 /DNA_START=31 /DNA_END=1044 /DNA_ORIENTATION=+
MQSLVTTTQSAITEKAKRLKALAVVENYLILSEIGEDHLYPVFLAAFIDSAKIELSDANFENSLRVIKAIPLKDRKGSFENECGVFQLKPHKNLLGCIDIIRNAKLDFRDYHEEYNLFVLPYLANGDLLDYLQKSYMEERVARYYFEHMIDAVEYMHSQGLAHRDLKTENFLLNDDFELVLTDFGHSVRHSDFLGPKLFGDYNAITSPGICPPEYYNGPGYRATEMDVFALGKMLLILVTGFNPFKNAKGTDSNFSLILKGEWNKFWLIIQGWIKKKWVKAEELTPEFKKLVESLLNPNPQLRPSIQQIRESSWFNNIQPKSAQEIQSLMIRSKISF